MTVNGIQLLDRIVADVAFVTELAAVGCITWPQREHLMNIVQPRDRNDKLLEFLTRRSVADFQKFINVLSKEQAYIVPLLLTDGGEMFDQVCRSADCYCVCLLFSLMFVIHDMTSCGKWLRRLCICSLCFLSFPMLSSDQIKQQYFCLAAICSTVWIRAYDADRDTLLLQVTNCTIVDYFALQ